MQRTGMLALVLVSFLCPFQAVQTRQGAPWLAFNVGLAHCDVRFHPVHRDAAHGVRQRLLLRHVEAGSFIIIQSCRGGGHHRDARDMIA